MKCKEQTVVRQTGAADEHSKVLEFLQRDLLYMIYIDSKDSGHARTRNRSRMHVVSSEEQTFLLLTG